MDFPTKYRLRLPKNFEPIAILMNCIYCNIEIKDIKPYNPKAEAICHCCDTVFAFNINSGKIYVIVFCFPYTNLRLFVDTYEESIKVNDNGKILYKSRWEWITPQLANEFITRFNSLRAFL